MAAHGGARDFVLCHVVLIIRASTIHLLRSGGSFGYVINVAWVAVFAGGSARC